MTYQCVLVERQARPTLSVRTRAAVERLPQVLGPAWGQVMACAGKAGAMPSDAPFVAYHGMDRRARAAARRAGVRVLAGRPAGGAAGGLRTRVVVPVR